MSEDQILLMLQKFIESGGLDKLPTPGSVGFQNLITYVPAILLAVLSFRVFVVNNVFKKFLGYQETKAQVMINLLAEVKRLSTEDLAEQKAILEKLLALAQSFAGSEAACNYLKDKAPSGKS